MFSLAQCLGMILAGHLCEETINFFQVLTPEFRHRALARAQGLHLEWGH